jgi:hypothetical protein
MSLKGNRTAFFCTAAGFLFGGLCLSSLAQQRATAPVASAAELQKLAAKPTPRTPDGHPDLSGYWGPPPQTRMLVADASSESSPVYKPEHEKKVEDLKKNSASEDPVRRCQPAGVPRMGPPWEIVQIPSTIYFIYGDVREGLRTRVIPIDGRPHDAEIDARPMGDSVGRWDGDTLVVDVIKLDDATWIDRTGPFHDEKLHVVERLTRKGDTLKYEVTVDDPPVLAKPWEKKPSTLVLNPGQHPIEGSPCRQ